MRSYYLRFLAATGLTQKLLLSIVFCLFLLSGRVAYSGSLAYIFLLWNLFLAFLPHFFSRRLLLSYKRLNAMILAILCLLFLPNAPYILTDLFHLRLAGERWLWFDTLLIVSFAWVGMMFFIHSLNALEDWLALRLPHWQRLLIMTLVCLLCGFGIYLGRYLRFNSWDLLSDPMSLLGEIAQRLCFPAAHPRCWGLTLAYGCFLLVAHLSLRRRVEIHSLNNDVRGE